MARASTSAEGLRSAELGQPVKCTSRQNQPAPGSEAGAAIESTGEVLIAHPAGVGVYPPATKVAKTLGLGTGTVQGSKQEMGAG